MKKYILFFLFLMALLPMTAFSQTDREDVIYAKDGSIYRGTIVEQIPNVSYKIEIAGGSVIVIKAEDVVKITKEDKKGTGDYAVRHYYEERPIRPKPVYEYKFRPKGYFFQAQVEAQALEFGFRIVNGYKFGRFGYLGFGLGVDGVILDIHGRQDYSGAYFPFYIHYGGDILKKQITPFYSIEAGYAFHPTPISGGDLSPLGGGSNTNVVSSKGGFIGGAGFGVRFYSRRRVHFDISAHVDFKQSFATTVTEMYNSVTGYDTDVYYTETSILIIPGVRFGIGF
jgi:hypothetical protein